MKKIILLILTLVFITSCVDKVLNEATVIESSIRDTLLIPSNPRGCIITKIDLWHDLNIYYTDTISNRVFGITFFEDNRQKGLEHYVIKLPNGLMIKK